MADWVTISALATAGGTLVLAGATFASVRSANRAARVAEESLLAGIRPLLMPSRLEDAPVKVSFVDNHLAWPRGWRHRRGDRQRALLRHLGAQRGQRHRGDDGWRVEWIADLPVESPSLDAFHRLTRDIYVAAGDVAFWQGAYRNPPNPSSPGSAS